MTHPYLPNTEIDRQEMLQALGVEGVEALFKDVAERLKAKGRLKLPKALSELELTQHLQEVSGQNQNLDDFPCFLGAGIYDHFVPAVVRHVLMRSEFYTSYTPYQPEASQGTLQAMFEFQSLVCRLTGMDVANASLYDGASALAEGVLMAHAVNGRRKVVIAKTLHPHYWQVARTYATGWGLEWVEAPYADGSTDMSALRQVMDDGVCAAVVQHPNFFGCLEQVADWEAAAHRVGALLVVVFDPISLGVLKPPGEYGADVAVAEGQSLGLPPSFGGPGVGLFTCKRDFIRKMPGRVIGETVDAHGRRGFVLTLQVREQHIRRERATSNICTNQSLCALAVAVYLSVMGSHGLRRVAELCTQKAHYAAEQLAAKSGFRLRFQQPFFKEFTLSCPVEPEELNRNLRTANIIGGLPLRTYFPELSDCMLVCVTEKRTREQIDRLVQTISKPTMTPKQG